VTGVQTCALPIYAMPAVASVATGNGSRRSRWLQRSVLIPAASAVTVLTAAVVVTAATLGGPGTSGALVSAGPTTSASTIATAADSAAPTAGTSSPAASTSAARTRGPSHGVAAAETPTTQAPPNGTSTTQAPSSVVKVKAAPPGAASTTPGPTVTPPGPKVISGTYTLTRQVVTCTFSSCGTTPLVLTLTCAASGSCTAYWSYWGTHAATFDGTTVDVSFTATGSINCKGTALPTAVDLNFSVLSWTAGQGGAVRTPTRMQGTYTESAPASTLGCQAAGTQQAVSYG